MDSKYLVSTTALSFASAGFLVGSPALAADAVKPLPKLITVAPDPLSGYIEAFLGIGHWSKYEDCCGSDDGGFHTIGGAGRLNYWLAPNKSMQLDVYGSGIAKDSTGFGVALHYSHRNPASGLWGLMFSVGQVDSSGWFGVAAVEGQMYTGMNGLTWYGQAGLIANLDGGGGTGGYVGLQGRWFSNPDTQFTVDGNFMAIYGDSLFRLGAEVEHKMAGKPLSLFARAQLDHLGWGGGHVNEIQGIFGIKFYVNQPTLQANNLMGATLLDLNPVFGEKRSRVW